MVLDKKVKTARLSIFSNTFLIVIKLAAGVITGSVSIISEAIHSALDLVAAIIAYFSVKISNIPPDRDHPYGHGKFENISGVVEGVLILIAAIWIIYEAIQKMIHQEPLEFLYIGIIVMAISAIVNVFVSRRLYAVARETDSIALEADALHLKTDVYTSLGIAIGILLIWITGFDVLDPVIAILVALFIIRESFELLRRAVSPLLDAKLPEEEVIIIRSRLDKYTEKCISYHNLRTRKSGAYRYVDFHLEVPENMSVKEAHDLCDRIEKDIRNEIRMIDINIHIEPCNTRINAGTDEENV